MEVKVRQVGSSMVVTVPSYFNIAEGKKFSVECLDNGTIVYTPVKENIFENPDILKFADDCKQTDLLLEEDIE
ncbi:type II toxin-antitoxin system PemI/MazE family antitoxin [Aerococcus mictus]